MTNLLKTETTSIVETACTELKGVNEQLVQLHEWTKKKIEQETQDRINSDTTIKEAGEAALKNIVSLTRKLRDPEDPLGTASTKGQRPPSDTTRNSYQQSKIPSPTLIKKEPRNVPQPDKYDRSSAKLKVILNDVATVMKQARVFASYVIYLVCAKYVVLSRYVLDVRLVLFQEVRLCRKVVLCQKYILLG